jgi:hypothetical protein
MDEELVRQQYQELCRRYGPWWDNFRLSGDVSGLSPFANTECALVAPDPDRRDSLQNHSALNGSLISHVLGLRAALGERRPAHYCYNCSPLFEWRVNDENYGIG